MYILIMVGDVTKVSGVAADQRTQLAVKSWTWLYRERRHMRDLSCAEVCRPRLKH